MKKIIMAAAVSLIIFNIAYAQTTLEEEDYKDLDKLHHKLVRMKREMDRLMKDVVSTYPPEEKNLLADFGQDIKVDIIENYKNIIVKADLPGMTKERLELSLENNRILKIAGTREIETRQTAPGMIRQERSFGRFERAIELPSEGENEGINARYENGVLEVIIPKRKGSKEEKVRINVQ